TGVGDVLCQTVASEMAVPYESVHCRVGNTSDVPYSVDVGFGGSRSTNINRHAAIQACGEVRKKLIAQGARMMEAAEDQVVYKAGKFSSSTKKGKPLTVSEVVGSTGG